MRYLLTALLLLLCATSAQAGVFVGFGSTAAPSEIYDDYSSDTEADYTGYGTNTLTVSSGVVVQDGTWSERGVYYHETSLGSPDQVVAAEITLQANSYSGLLVRASGTTGYVIVPSAGGLSIVTTSSDGNTWTYAGGILYDNSKTWADTASYLVEITIAGSTLSAKIDWTGDGDFLDADESCTETFTTSISTGNYSGLAFYNNGAQPPIDNFSAEAY